MATQAERTEAMRETLLGAARTRFAAQGYAATSVAEVLDDAGVSKGALYHHFPTKEALFEGVFEAVEQEVMGRVAEQVAVTDDPVETLRSGCAAWLSVVTEPDLAAISLIEAPAALGWARWRELDERYGFGLLKGLMSRAAEAGRLRVRDPAIAAHALLATLGELALVIARSDDRTGARGDALAVLASQIDGMTD